MVAAFTQPQLTWNLGRDVAQLFDYPFMINALRAGTIVAVVAALIGWFMVIRRQTFAGHTLAVVGFPGAAGATLIGVSAAYGALAFCVVAALVIGALPRAPRVGYSEESAVIGVVQAFALGCGFLFVSLYAGNLNGINALLFGSFLGITPSQVVSLLVAGAVAVAALAAVARPLLFASLDPDVAAARGVPVRLLSAGFLVLLGVAAAEVSQVTGTLLVFALLVLPAATAQTITLRPVASVVWSVAIALTVTWVGMGVAYYSSYPIGFWITSLAFGLFVLARSGRAVADRVGSGGGRAGAGHRPPPVGAIS
jgi:zinc/manganese transport system permease protein